MLMDRVDQQPFAVRLIGHDVLIEVNSPAHSDVSETVHVGTGVTAHAESLSGDCNAAS